MKTNLDHPVIDEREDGTRIHFHDLPPILLKCPYIITPEDDAPPNKEQTTD